MKRNQWLKLSDKFNFFSLEVWAFVFYWHISFTTIWFFTCPTIIAYKSENSIKEAQQGFPSVKWWLFVIPEPRQEAMLCFYLTFNVLQLLKNYSLRSETAENQSLPSIISNKYVCLYFPREVTENTDNEQLFDRHI